MVVRWIFTDPVTTDTYTVPVNPNKGGTPTRNKNITYLNTAGPGGNVLAFEGRDDTQQIQVSGVILEQAHLDAFNTWFDKRYQITVTDDLSRVFSIYITNFDATRINSRSHPWKHEYTLSYVIIDWT